ncbi:MAG: carboxypeptidase regulatory-like domain-containing protein [bacterium]|nr:carboxypeptidase regulatory-like domain-containing protein [bacterium]
MLFRAQDSTQVTGIATTANGSFTLDSLRPGKYFARVNFLGYETKTLSNLNLNREQQKLNLGKIQLTPSGLSTDEVVVQGERLSVEYHVEKKVINVAKQNIAPTGTAADILAQAPSVSVDIEGNVKLRGSSNFTVMIDGRPSILDANDALQQIPSGTIDKIEIITNPSSRFSAEGRRVLLISSPCAAERMEFPAKSMPARASTNDAVRTLLFKDQLVKLH